MLACVVMVDGVVFGLLCNISYVKLELYSIQFFFFCPSHAHGQFKYCADTDSLAHIRGYAFKTMCMYGYCLCWLTLLLFLGLTD